MYQFLIDERPVFLQLVEIRLIRVLILHAFMFFVLSFYSTRHTNLTMKYWAKKALYSLQSDVLRVKITEFLNRPPEKQAIEEGR
jgi:hypothetical protein